MDKLAEATKLAKQVDRGGVDEAIQFAHDVVGGKLKAAEKENEFVYHEKVPEKATLPEIKGASLVKGTPFDITDPEVSGQDIFHRLVPMEAHEASSLYSEEKAKLLRRIGASVEEKDQELAMFLASLQVHFNLSIIDFSRNRSNCTLLTNRWISSSSTTSRRPCHRNSLIVVQRSVFSQMPSDRWWKPCQSCLRSTLMLRLV